MGVLKLSEIESICKEFKIKDYTINNDGSINVNNGGVWMAEKGLTKIPIKFGTVNGIFHCGGNELTTLENCPDRIFGHFYCFGNRIESFVGGPRAVKGRFDASHNPLLISFEGFPTQITETTNHDYDFNKCPVDEILQFFGTLDAIEYINEYDVLDFNKKEDWPWDVSYTKLSTVSEELGLSPIRRDMVDIHNRRLRFFRIIED